MKEFKGTQGPWVWSNLNEDENSLRGACGRLVLWGDNMPSGLQEDDGWSARMGATHSDDESEFNAKLIAAAPDLLEALQCAIDHVREQAKHDGLAFGHLQVCQKAIARALGKNNGDE